MIRLPDVSLPARARTQLKKYQGDVDAGGGYEARVALAKKLFPRRNTKSNATFRAVKNALDEMCSGARRCAYCEDSAADEVEHIRPKDLYPEGTFDWDNYLYACGPCNSPKGSRFAVFPFGSDEALEVGRKKDDPIVPPQQGDDVLVNPRSEEAMELLVLDLVDTFWLIPREGLSARQRRRAEYTLEVLHLNDRDILPAARREAFVDYFNFVLRYAHDRDAGASPQALRALSELLLGKQHPTVWREMQRQRDVIPELSKLFGRVPEAATW